MEGGHHPARWPPHPEQAGRSGVVLLSEQLQAQSDVSIMKAGQPDDEGMKKRCFGLVDHRRRTVVNGQVGSKGSELLAEREA
jgi:hypothetical protein